MPRASIALVTLDYPPERGGVARYLGNLVHTSQGAIDVFVPETHQTSGPGHVRQARLIKRGWPAWWPMINFIRSLSRRGHSYVLVSHALPVGTAAWLSRMMGGPRYVVLFHGLDLRLALRSIKTRWVLHRVLRSASMIIANSEFVAREIKQFDATIKSTVITPGVEPLELPDRNTARQNCGLSDHTFVILAVARLVMRKGIDLLIQAMNELPTHVKLVIIGDGTDRHRLEHLAFAIKDRVTFLPHATDHERNAWYAAADIFALPARDEGGDVEGFGIVYLEAALAGLPVIAGKSGGATEAVVDGETGMLIKPNDPAALTSAIQKLMEDPTLRQRMGQAGRERALRDFGWIDRWEQLRDFFNKNI